MYDHSFFYKKQVREKNIFLYQDFPENRWVKLKQAFSYL
jgi:hypothetical protein